jgi:hypothetical protein
MLKRPVVVSTCSIGASTTAVATAVHAAQNGTSCGENNLDCGYEWEVRDGAVASREEDEVAARRNLNSR